MTDKLTKDENPIDKTSQRILQHLHSLRGGEVPTATSSDLRDEVGVESSQVITYRINTHLSPANLVTWTEEDTTGAVGSRRYYQLTQEGAEWVSDHAEDLARPSDLDDTADTAQEALSVAQEAFEEAERAKESVRNYRQKLARLKTRVTGKEDPDYEGYWEKKGHEQRIEDIEDQQETLTQRVNSKASGEQAAAADLRSEDNAAAIEDLREELEAVRDELDDRAELDDIDTIHNRLDDFEARIEDVEATQQDFAEWSHSIDSRIKDVEQRQSQGLLRRILPF